MSNSPSIIGRVGPAIRDRVTPIAMTRSRSRHQSILVPRYDAGLFVGFRQKIESETPARIVHAIMQRQSERDQRIEQTVLGQLVQTSVGQIIGHRKIRDNSVVTAGKTKISRAVSRHDPVAPVELCIGAKSVLRPLQS